MVSITTTQNGSLEKLQKPVGRELIERLKWVLIQPKVILDLGTNGALTRKLVTRYPSARVVGLESAESVLRCAIKKVPFRFFRQPRYVCGYATHLPFAGNTLDLVFSNLRLLNSQDLFGVFREVRRVLSGGGLFTFSILSSMEQVLQTSSAPVLDIHQVGNMLIAAGLLDPVLDVGTYTNHSNHSWTSSVIFGHAWQPEVTRSSGTRIPIYRVE